MNGIPGARGRRGRRGNTGSKGKPGPRGPLGTDGLKGEKGDKGDTGYVGDGANCTCMYLLRSFYSINTRKSCFRDCNHARFKAARQVTKTTAGRTPVLMLHFYKYCMAIY